MHLALYLLATTKSTGKSSSSGSSGAVFFVILIGLAVLYFFVLRPRSRKMREQRQGGGSTLSVGDEVISAGGILGTVTAVAGDEIVVEVAPGTSLTFWRRAINLRTAVPGAPQTTSDDGNDVYPDPSFDAHDDDDGDDGYDEEEAEESWEDDGGEVPGVPRNSGLSGDLGLPGDFGFGEDHGLPGESDQADEGNDPAGGDPAPTGESGGAAAGPDDDAPTGPSTIEAPSEDGSGDEHRDPPGEGH